jgi:hypothetical protein
MHRVLMLAGLLTLGACGDQDPAGAATMPTQPVRAMVGDWNVAREAPDRCFADFHLPEGRSLTFLAYRGGVSFSARQQEPLPPGGRGRFETDVGSFEFKPSIGRSGNYVYLDDDLSPDALAILRRAKGVRVSLGDHVVASPLVEGTGLPEALDAIIDCSKGQKGAWEKPAAR